MCLREGADNGLDLVLVSHGGQDGRVTQHTVVQRVLSLESGDIIVLLWLKIASVGSMNYLNLLL